MERCISCGKTARLFAAFKDPFSDATIVRCNQCRLNKNTYTSPGGFVGP